MRVTDARLIFYFLRPLSFPRTPTLPSCRFLLLCGQHYCRKLPLPREPDRRKLLSREQPRALPILVSRTLFTLLPSGSPHSPPSRTTHRSLHQAAPLVHNKGSTPCEASTDSTEFQWPQSQIASPLARSLAVWLCLVCIY